MLISRRSSKIVVTVAVVLVAMLIAVLPALASHEFDLQAVSCDLGSNSVTITGTLFGGGGGSINVAIYVDGNLIDSYLDNPPLGPLSVTLSYGADVLIEGALVEVQEGGNDTQLVSTICTFSEHDPEAPPDIFLSAVCEPFDGFSGDGWMTVHSNAASKPFGTALYVAAGPDGPWVATEFLQPPYILSQAHADALAALVGLTDYHLLWLKASEWGIPANLGSMIIDREAHMDALCGT